MPSGKSDYLKNKILDHNLGDGAFTMPATVAIGLWTSALDASSTGATAGEANYTGYARVVVAASDLSAASAGAKTNSAVLTFPDCTAGDDTVIYFAILDSATIGAGNILYWGSCPSVVIDTTHTPPRVPIGDLDLAET